MLLGCRVTAGLHVQGACMPSHSRQGLATCATHPASGRRPLCSMSGIQRVRLSSELPGLTMHCALLVLCVAGVQVQGQAPLVSYQAVQHWPGWWALGLPDWFLWVSRVAQICDDSPPDNAAASPAAVLMHICVAAAGARTTSAPSSTPAATSATTCPSGSRWRRSAAAATPTRSSSRSCLSTWRRASHTAVHPAAAAGASATAPTTLTAHPGSTACRRWRSLSTRPAGCELLCGAQGGEGAQTLCTVGLVVGVGQQALYRLATVTSSE